MVDSEDRSDDSKATEGRQSGSPEVSFKELARGGREVCIELDGQIYRLRLTRNGKLILNK